MYPTSDEERLWGMLAHLLTLLGYVVVLGQYIAPLVIYLVYRERSKFVAFHALQALYFQLAVLVLTILVTSVLVLVSIVTCGVGAILTIPVVLAATVLVLYYTIRPAIEANNGNWYEIPLVGGWARTSVGV